MQAGGIFTGERWEAYTGLVFLRARYYEPAIGRFIGHDASSGDMQRPMTLHGWVYAQDNPLIYTDPSGLRDSPPCPPSGMYWKYVGIYSISPYGHPIHSKFAERGGPTLTLKWRDTKGVWHLTENVSKSWYDNTRPETGEGTAGKLDKPDMRTVFVKCPTGTDYCLEKTEQDAKKGGWGNSLEPYQDAARNATYNTDLEDDDTVFIQGGNGPVSISDHGRGQAGWTPGQMAKWLDLYVGEHGFRDWDMSKVGSKKVWVLRQDPYQCPPPPCGCKYCPF